jgi:hypothetical protein
VPIFRQCYKTFLTLSLFSGDMAPPGPQHTEYDSGVAMDT